MARTGVNGHIPNERGETSLDAAMRAPSTTTPDVIVLGFVDPDVKAEDRTDPKKDLWLTTVDGRHQSAIIPIRVGPAPEIFSVHRDILTRSEYFRKALDGEFREAGDQAIDLPEEDPAIFSFVVAFLYEKTFAPIKPVSTVLIAEPDKGKGREVDDSSNSGSDDLDSGSASDESTRSRRRRDNRRRREERAWEQRQRKEPGRHRPDCSCATCTAEAVGPPCWHCGVSRRPPPLRPRAWNNNLPPPPHPVVIGPGRPPPRIRPRDRRRGPRNNPDEPAAEERMSPEDLRTWALAYGLSVDVYVCAERYLMQDFKACISDSIINNFEIAGLEAAQPAVLQSCKTLYAGLSPLDPLLKKVLARIGFLQGRLWKNFPEDTARFFTENPELAMVIMKEMVERREEDTKDELPAMERLEPVMAPVDEIIVHGPVRRNRPEYW